MASALPDWPPPGGKRDPQRRQRILLAAAELVAERGYHDVGMSDIGAAAGITGSAIYRHFDSKSAVLVAMFDAVVDDLSRQASRIGADGGDPQAVLRRLVATQVAFVLRHGALARVYYREGASLPPADQHRLRRGQRMYLEEWERALARIRPADTGDVRRALVHASVGAIQSVLFFRSGLPAGSLAALLTTVTEAALLADPRLPAITRLLITQRQMIPVDFTDTDEHRALREAVAAVTAPFGGAYFAGHAERREPTRELWQALAKPGFIGINIPERFGGGGAGLAELAVVCEESAAQGCPLLILLVSSAISGEVLSRYGTPAQQETWLPGLASGDATIVFAITEPDAGSNTHRLTTTATREAGSGGEPGWRLNGTKYYISGVDEADAVLVVARTGTDEVTGHARLSLFLVPADAPGLTRQPLPVSVPLPERQFTLYFDDVRVGADHLVGAEGDGFAQVFHGLNPERITGAALGVGIGRYALRQAAAYAGTRSVWGVPTGTHQGVSHPLAKAKIEVELAALMTAKAAWQHDHGQPAGEAANMAKYAAAEAALAAVDAAIQAHGGNGLATEYGLFPLWGMARLLRIAPVSREMILNYVAQHSLGLPRSY